MTTGYTQAVLDGASFGQFVWRCARGFGAFVELREDDMKQDVSGYEPQLSDHHPKCAAVAEAEIARLERMTPAQASAASLAEWKEVRDCNREMREVARKEAEKFASMRDRVRAWEPPTEEHVALKAFMLEQLESSLQWASCHEPPRRSEPLTGEQWRAERLTKHRVDLGYHREQQRQEEERVRERRQWIKALKNSVPYEVPR